MFGGFFLSLQNGYHKNNTSDTVNDSRSDRIIYATTRVNKIWMDRKVSVDNASIRYPT